MSLFKVREFWSFDLGQLNQKSLTSNERESVESGDENEVNLGGEEASFIFSTGRFSSIGQYDVFVCGSLEGLICILQVPESEQQLTDVRNQTSRDERGLREKDIGEFSSHHLLVANQLGFPIVDIKCGFYTSTLKQSIAVLSFSKLVIYQVKKRQVDLLSSNFSAAYQKGTLDENFLSHKVEEVYRFELLQNEIASGILTINNHTQNNLHEEDLSYRSKSDSASNISLKRSDKSSSSILILPQRESIVIIYTNQLVFTLIEHKKITGHFQLLLPFMNSSTLDNQKDEREFQVQKLARYVGSMPMAFLKDSSSGSLIVTTSDREIYCLPITKIISQVKQNVMRRVTQALLQDNATKTSLKSKDKKSSLAYDNDTSSSRENLNEPLLINEIELSSMATWQVTLTCAPLQIETVIRGEASSSSTSIFTSQLLIMSRYSLNLFSANSGTHLWTSRFETPLLCMHSYCLKGELVGDVERGGRLISLICADNLSNNNCNFFIMQENQLVWSALLGTRATQLCRANLGKMSGVIAILDASGSSLVLSYLGTNLESREDQLIVNSNKEDEGEESILAQLETLDEHILDSENNLTCEDSQTISEKCQKLLLFDVRLEALNHWPNIRINSSISLKPEPTCSRVLQNLVAVLEFDDLIVYESLDDLPTTNLSINVVQVELGNCWPDRREPLSFSGCFSMQPQASINLALLPKSLKVNVFLKLTESNVGTQIQEESFMLPLNLVSQLAHIDYSTDQNQIPDDANFNLHEGMTEQTLLAEDAIQPNTTLCYLCDICLRTPGGIINLMDEIIESDLICRGLNSESKSGRQRLGKNSLESNLSTLENIDLLAQSLDCRLRYKSLSNPTKIVSQSSEEQLPVARICSAFKISNGSLTLQECEKAFPETKQSSSNQSIVWLHLYDLSDDSSAVAKEVIRQHSKNWKIINLQLEREDKPVDENCLPILITITGEHPIPVLFFQSHLIERLRKRTFSYDNQYFQIDPLDEKTYDQINANFDGILRIHNWFAIGTSLHDSLRLYINYYNSTFRDRYKRLKGDLDSETYKFYISTKTSLSLSKRLFKLPPDMLRQFNTLSVITKKYQLNLIRILSELENLKQINYYHSKLPIVPEIMLEDCGDKLIFKMPNFIQLIDSNFQ